MCFCNGNGQRNQSRCWKRFLTKSVDGEVAWNPRPLLALKDWMRLLISKMGWTWVELLPKWWPFSNKSSTQRQGDHVSHFSCATISMSVRHFREQTSGIGRGVQSLVVGEEQRYVAIFRKRAWWTVDDCPKVDEAQAFTPIESDLGVIFHALESPQAIQWIKQLVEGIRYGRWRQQANDSKWQQNKCSHKETSHPHPLLHLSHVLNMTTHKCHHCHECPTPTSTASCEAESWQGNALHTWKDIHGHLCTSLNFSWSCLIPSPSICFSK